jgi:hypothetical protein
MSSALSAKKRFVFLGLFAGIATAVLAQNTYSPQGGEYPIAGYLPGDQTYPQISVGTNGGYVVWQDNVTDGDGLGISARRVDGNFIGRYGVFRVNERGAAEQESPRVALLNNGGAVFVWQGGIPGFQHIYARFLKADGTFAAGDQLVNTYTNNHQIDPALTVLSDGNVVVTWSSYGQERQERPDLSMYGVYAQMFSPAGDKISSEFLVNQTTLLNQRSSSIAALSDGGFALAWVSERQTTKSLSSQDGLILATNDFPRYTAEIFGRVFGADGSPRGEEFRISAANDPCATPVISAFKLGGFSVAWGGRDGLVFNNSWDIFARCFTPGGFPVGAEVRLNAYTFGNQFAPKVASLGQDSLVVWTSVGQDAAREEVYGRFLSSSGGLVGDEFRVNTTTVSQQIHPAVASDGNSRFVAVWTSFIGGDSSFDVFAQRYNMSESVPVPGAPFVSALSQSRLSVTWPELDGFSVDHYEIYTDSNATPVIVTNNTLTASGFVAGSTHTFRLSYQLTDGRRSAVSASATGKTWGEDTNLDGLPDDWEELYWGSAPSAWPAPNADSDGDGATNLQEFLAGTTPTDANSVLRAQIVATSQGTHLSWNSQPGYIYQVQMSTNLGAGSWTAFGTARFAAETSDSLLLNGTNAASYYRVIRLR